MNKKGISAVVTTVLIILLSIIAVIILWAALRPTLSNTAGKTNTAISCTEVGLNIDSCTVTDTGVNVVVSRQGGADNVSVTVSVSDADSSVQGTATEVGPLDTRTITTTKTDLSGALTVQAAATLADETLCTPVSKACGTA
jgi:hypothetical protein